jgi:hypothetical protein
MFRTTELRDSSFRRIERHGHRTLKGNRQQVIEQKEAIFILRKLISPWKSLVFNTTALPCHVSTEEGHRNVHTMIIVRGPVCRILHKSILSTTGSILFITFWV